MPRKNSLTGDLFATDDELFGDAEESQDLKSEQDDHTKQADLTEQINQTDTAGKTQIHNTDGAYQTGNSTEIQEAHLTELTANPPPVGKREETKSKRLNLLIRPGILKQFAKIAYMQQTSVNELINRLIAEHVDKKPETIKEYDRLFKDKNAR